MEGYRLRVTFDDGYVVYYDVLDDIRTIPAFQDLQNVYGLFQHAQLDDSRTCIYWNDEIDLPSDTIYEYGTQDNGLLCVAEDNPPEYNGNFK